MPDRCDSVGTPLPFTKGRGRGWGQIIYNGLINREKARKTQTYAKILGNYIAVDLNILSANSAQRGSPLSIVRPVFIIVLQTLAGLNDVHDIVAQLLAL